VFDAPPADGLHDIYDFRTTSPGRTRIGPFDIELTPTAHPIECYAVRVTAGGRSITYSADTGPSDDVARAASGTDVFLCESTWLDSAPYPPNLHLTAREAGQHAAKAGAGRLALIHTTAYMEQDRFVEEASEAYDGAIDLAKPGLTYEL
jgi:ribonuclease BN (tRNA processing enzyme)